MELKRRLAGAVLAAMGAGALAAGEPVHAQAPAPARPPAQASAPAAGAGGAGDAGYVWNEMTGEKLVALRAKGDAARGAIAFEVCQGCHRAGALGRPDGSYPRLAGQHDTVLIKQMTDVRAGLRQNPKMLPFANSHVIGPQDIADIAVFLQGLPSPADNGRGPGENLARAKTLYEADCVQCHGARGEGEADRFHPRVAGQHYRYLLREALAIRDGGRHNADPRMIRVVKPYSDADLALVADYMSRLQ